MERKKAEIKIAVVNAIYGGNKGAEAMLLALIDNLKDNFNNLIIYNEIEERSDDIMKVIEMFADEFGDEKCKIHLYKFNPRKTFKNILFGYYSGSKKVNADLVIDIGGLSFHDASPRGSLRTYLKHLPFILRRTKRIFFTQDFGPLKTKLNKWFAIRTLKNAHSIFTRSEESKQALINDLKLEEQKIYGPFPDSTITLRPEKYIEEKIKALKPFFLISPSIVMYNKYGDRYVEYFNDLISCVKNDFKIVLLNHNFVSKGQRGDEFVCNKIKNVHEDIIFVNENVNSRKLKYIIANSSIVLSSRFHVIVAALSSNVPAIAVGWNPKYENILGLYKMEKYNLVFDEHILPKTKNLLEQLNLEIESGNINAYNVSLKNNVDKSYKLINEKINSILSN